MTPSSQTLVDLIAPPVLQHLSDTFSEKYKIAMIFYDHQGRPLTQMTLSPISGLTGGKPLNGFIHKVLAATPDAEEMGLADGKTVYSSFFNGLLRRALLPIVYYQRYLGVCLYACVETTQSNELKKWNFVLEGFSSEGLDPLAYMDQELYPPTEAMILVSSGLHSQWQRLLEAGRQQWLAGSSESADAADEPAEGLQGSVITTTSLDIIAADLPAIAALGYENTDEMVGLNFLTHLTAQPSKRAELAEFIENDAPVQQFELELCRKDGSPVWVVLSVHPQKSFQDVPVGYQFLFYEKDVVGTSAQPPQETTAEDEEPPSITKPKSTQLRDQLRDLYQKLSSQPEQGASLIRTPARPALVLDPADQVVVWNEAMQELLHIPAASILRNDFDQLLVSDSQPTWRAALERFRQDHDLTEQPLSRPLTLLDNQGNPKEVCVHLSKNDLLGLQLITVAVTGTGDGPEAETLNAGQPPAVEDQALIEELAAARVWRRGADLERLQQLVAALAGNLEQPLLSAFSRSAWLYLPSSIPHSQQDPFLHLQQDIEQTFMLLRRLQYFSQSVPLRRRPVPINTLVRQAGGLQAELFARPVQVHFDLSPLSGRVMADVSLLHQAFEYICRNALEALQRTGGRLLIRTRPAELPDSAEPVAAVVVEVLDNGPGIADCVWQRLCEPFITTKPEGHGHGLGLAAAYGIVAGHQGRLIVHSQINAGTLVQLFLPALAPEQAPEDLEASVIAFRQARSLLIVDDDPDLTPLMKRALENNGYEVTTLETGERAIQWMQGHVDEVDGAVIDLSLEGMSGLDCAKKILQEKRIPIILSSGYPPVPAALEVVQACQGAYLQKPYGMSYLVEMARQTF
ncbi:response regulator [bacterium]|nr:response regulator [bacterium]